MIKIYPVKFRSLTDYVTLNVIFGIICFVILIIALPYDNINGFTEWLIAISVLSLMFLVFCIIPIATQYFYVILTDDKLIIKNAILPFLIKRELLS